jgi:TIR domain
MPILFLSHSGADTEAARALKKRIEDSPAAKVAGLKVWFDKDDLHAGKGWQKQLAATIEKEADAFAVLLGARGVVNWVDAEVEVALSRATTSAFPFIPIIAKESEGSNALPAFARRYQGVLDPLNDSGELAKLIKAATGDWDRAVILTDEPFVGLRSMDESWANRFFGRQAEVRELVDKFKKHRLVAIVADSGAGRRGSFRRFAAAHWPTRAARGRTKKSGTSSSCAQAVIRSRVLRMGSPTPHNFLDWTAPNNRSCAAG